MNIKHIRKIALLPLAAFMLTGSALLAGPVSPGVGPPDVQSENQSSSTQASQLLEEIQSITRSLERDAGTLNSYRNKGLSWQSHAVQLNLAKQHINAIGDRLETLQQIQSTAEPWQQDAIAAIVPVAVELASRTTDAINHLNEYQSRLFVPAYTGHLSAIYENANQMKESVDLHLDLASTQDKLDRFEERVAVAES
jgi:hypothetical protein